MKKIMLIAVGIFFMAVSLSAVAPQLKVGNQSGLAFYDPSTGVVYSAAVFTDADGRTFTAYFPRISAAVHLTAVALTDEWSSFDLAELAGAAGPYEIIYHNIGGVSANEIMGVAVYFDDEEPPTDYEGRPMAVGAMERADGPFDEGAVLWLRAKTTPTVGDFEIRPIR